MTTLANILANAKTKFDLTETADQHSLYQLTHQLLDLPPDEVLTAARQLDAPLEFKIAAKLVDSRQFLLNNQQPVRIGVVFAMWGEQNRLRPKTAENPNGEDALRVKLHQLEWATKDTAVTWNLYAVDDGDPKDSGALAAQIAAEHPLGDQVKVLWLDKALPADDGPLANLASANDSRKGGAVIYGCMQALADGVDAVIYTDADNSVHLGQIGLLLRPYLQNNARVVLGNRKHPDAVLVKQEGRWGIGIKVLRHMQRMIGQAIFSRDIRDTQAAFKLYEADLLRKIIADPSVFDFSFDTDWILAAIARGEPLEKVPFAFIDSAAESASITQGPMTTWETLLLGLTKAVRKHGVPHNEAMARVLDEEIHDYRDLELLINHLPPELETAADADLGNPAIMSPEAMQVWIRERKHI
ncbi:glycosyltransferase [Candidatus Leptofilum sp.]|uniref:glycosyltransferase n=1 Tax=Candidatus Leptofilum sp. TaxID=3241576 RepID=UPI003B59F951